MKQAKSPITKFMQDNPASADEIETLRRKAWVEQGVLMICPSDPRLSEDQRNMLLLIAEARYGYGGTK
jgi:hypothetical protein